MTSVTYIEHDGTEHTVDLGDGQSVMQGAISNMVPGIVADCGGACACATCHVYVDPAWVERTGMAGDLERDMLEVVEDRRDNSRLSCQIRVTRNLDGLVVRLPESQG